MSNPVVRVAFPPGRGVTLLRCLSSLSLSWPVLLDTSSRHLLASLAGSGSGVPQQARPQQESTDRRTEPDIRLIRQTSASVKRLAQMFLRIVTQGVMALLMLTSACK